MDKDTTITSADYQAMLKKMDRIEEENEMLTEAMTIFAKKQVQSINSFVTIETTMILSLYVVS